MLRAVDYKTSAGRINPLDFLQTLRGENWREIRVKNPAIKVFQYERDSDFFQANIPIDRGLVDFDSAMLRAVETLAEVRGANVEQTLIELTTPVSDVLRVRLQSDSCANGSVFFDDAVRLYASLKALISSAASDANKPAAYHRGARVSRVGTFVKSCRFSQTEVGSYVVSAFLPLKSAEVAGTFGSDAEFQDVVFSESLGRKTGSHIMESSSSVLKNAFEANPLETIGRSVLEKRFSVNFLEALKNLCDFDDKSSLEITGRWSPFATRNRPAQSSFRLSRDCINVLSEAIDYIGERLTPEETSLHGVGRVKQLGAEPDASTRTEGKITVYAFLGQSKQAKAITMKLNADNYAKACQAHQNGWFIHFSGKRNGKGFVCDRFNVCEESTVSER